MADIPVVKSYQQILAGMINRFTSKIGISNLRTASPIVSLLESAAQSDFRDSMQVMQMLNSWDLDSSSGLGLLRIGKAEGVPKITQSPATGRVTIYDASFNKISTQLYQGLPAPIVGSTTINVVDAVLMPASGTIYIGRGTSAYEGPISYTSKVDNTSYWTLNLATPTTKFHNVTESVILGQGGDRAVGPDDVVRTPQGNLTSAVDFRIQFPAVIPDGEASLANVSVIAETPGTSGNVGAHAISEFVSPPFTGASVTNEVPFTTGTDTESDDDYKARIRDARASKVKGTSLAITSSVVGVRALDENKTVSSATLVKKKGLPTVLYIDDGTGYEEITQGVSVETLMNSATGGEQFFDTVNKPIAKAFCISTNSSPFALVSEQVLSVKVGGTTYSHIFDDSDFRTISNATSYEICSSINKNYGIAFSARTIENGNKVVLFAKAESNEEIEVVPNDNDANDILGFSTGTSFTTQLYKNDIRLNKDGRTAKLLANPLGSWGAMSGNQTLILSVDGTPSLTFTFTDQDFIDQSTGFNTVGINSAEAWVKVINAVVPGVTAGIDNGIMFIQSNAGPTSKSALSITGGSLTAVNMFEVESITGLNSDYTLDRNGGRIALTVPLDPGDSLSLGSAATRAFVESDSIPTTTLASNIKAWLNVDGDASLVPTGITPTTTLTFSPDIVEGWGYKLNVQSSGVADFTNVLPDDWIVLWDNSINASLKGAWRVASVISPTTISVDRRLGLAARSGHRSVAMSPVGADISRVFTAGGYVRSLPNFTFGIAPLGVTAGCEIYDPNTKLSSVAASMSTPRAYHTTTALSNGKILVTGGIDHTGTYLSSVEVYDPTTDTWAVKTPLAGAVSHHRAVVLADNKVLICGGYNGSTCSTAASIYDPTADTVTNIAGTLGTARANFGIVLLPDTKVLIAGGVLTGGTATATCELFDHSTDSFSATGSMDIARFGNSIGLIGTVPTTVVTMGNSALSSDANSNKYQIYTIGTGSWAASVALPNTTAVREVSLAHCQNGANYVFFGVNTTSDQNSSVKCDPSATFSTIYNSYSQNDEVYELQAVTLYNTAGTYLNHIVTIGGVQEVLSSGTIDPSGAIEEFNANTDTFTIPDPAIGSVVTTEAGVSVIRTTGTLQEIEIPAASNYTASSLVEEMNLDLDGASASVYKTNKIRINTNTHGLDGDTSLVAQDSTFDNFGFISKNATQNITGHVGSIRSSGSEVAIPSFKAITIRGTVSKVAPEASSALIVNETGIDPSYSLVGLRNFHNGKTGGAYVRTGTNLNYNTTLLSSLDLSSSSRLETRKEPISVRMPFDRVYAAAPFAVTPVDNLVVTVDNDSDKEFNIKMGRKLAVVGTTYSQTNTFKDLDGGNKSISETFGVDYNFDDFAVYMQPRAVLYSGGGTPNQRMLARYFRFGADGNGSRVRFSNPDAPNSTVDVVTSVDVTDTTDIRIKLASGALRTPVVRGTTRVGRVCTSSTTGIGTLVYVLNLPISGAARVSNVTTLTLTLPSGVTDHGLAINDTIWLQSSSGLFPSGSYLITGRTATTITYTDPLSDNAAGAIGTVSFDSAGEATFTGSGAIVGDFFRLNDSTGVSGLFFNSTFYVGTVNAGHLIMTSGEQTGYSPGGTLTWSQVSAPNSLQVFVNPAQTANQIISAVNALAGVTDSKVPITLTVLGAGTGTIIKSTPEFLADASSWYTLTDGINWVKKTISAISPSNYQLTFKNVPTGSLSTTSDWVNEVVYIVPVSLTNLIDWLNTPTVTGLWTSAVIDSAADGTKLQISSKTPGSLNGIKIQGGLSNLTTAAVVGGLKSTANHAISTIKKSDGNGLTGGQWVKIQNTNPLPRSAVLGVSTQLVSINTDGMVTVNNPLYTIKASEVTAQLMFERQGDYVAISDIGRNGGLDFNTVSTGDYVRLYTAAAPSPVPDTVTQNLGIYRIVRAVGEKDGSGGTLWIENSNVIEETSTCGIMIFDGSTSVIPGDKLSINSPIWGTDNQGVWTVESVGTTTASSNDPFTVNTKMKLSTSERIPSPMGAVGALGDDTNYIYIVEGVAGSFLMKVDGIVPNQADGAYLDVRWDSLVNNSSISSAAGSVCSVANKLGFDTGFVAGADGYNYDIGLIGEVSRVIYGDQSDPATYPGVEADGADINVSGPLIKRISITLGIRVRSPATEGDVAARVRSTVAAFINKSKHGTNIAISDIVRVAQGVVGVVAVTVINPTYGVGSDVIQVSPYEKAMVLNLDEDVQILFTGA